MPSANVQTIWLPVHKEIVVSHFLHSLLKQVEVGRVGVERVSEVAMVTEGREGGRVMVPVLCYAAHLLKDTVLNWRLRVPLTACCQW